MITVVYYCVVVAVVKELNYLRDPQLQWPWNMPGITDTFSWSTSNTVNLYTECVWERERKLFYWQNEISQLYSCNWMWNCVLQLCVVFTHKIIILTQREPGHRTAYSYQSRPWPSAWQPVILHSVKPCRARHVHIHSNSAISHVYFLNLFNAAKHGRFGIYFIYSIHLFVHLSDCTSLWLLKTKGYIGMNFFALHNHTSTFYTTVTTGLNSSYEWAYLLTPLLYIHDPSRRETWILPLLYNYSIV